MYSILDRGKLASLHSHTDQSTRRAPQQATIVVPLSAAHIERLLPSYSNQSSLAAQRERQHNHLKVGNEIHRVNVGQSRKTCVWYLTKETCTSSTGIIFRSNMFLFPWSETTHMSFVSTDHRGAPFSRRVRSLSLSPSLLFSFALFRFSATFFHFFVPDFLCKSLLFFIDCNCK